QVTGGLLRKEPERLKGEAGGEDPHEGFLLSLVECPTAVVGEHTAQQQQQQLPSHSLSVLSNLRHPAALFQRRQRSQSADEIKAEASSHFYLNESEELYEDDEGSDAPSSPTKLKSPAVFTTFKKKLQHSFRTRPKLESDMFSSGPPLLRKLHECTCSKCKEVIFLSNNKLVAEASNLREDLQCKEDELSASKEVIKVLRQQLDLANTERETL
ncbi:unnamed protein product, partial [Ixodes pacificus]